MFSGRIIRPNLAIPEKDGLLEEQTAGRVLLIGDQDKDLSAASEALEQDGYQYLIAPDGETGLERAALAQPDLILLDAHVSAPDAYETCRLLKRHAATCEVPVLLMAPAGAEADRIAFFEAGCADYVTRPIERPEFLARVRAHVEGSRLRRALARKISEHGHAERALRERVKELDCLYGISRLTDNPAAALEEILQGIVELIPPAWQSPEVTCARIRLDDQEFRTQNFQQTAWCQTASVQVRGAQAGVVDVCLLEERATPDEGRFLTEENYLLEAIAERTGHIVERMRAEAERQQAEAILKLRLRLVELAADHSLEELMQHALDEIGEITHSPIGFYHFVEADQKTLSLQAWSTRTRREFCTAEGKGMHYDLDQAGVWVDCVHQRKPVMHNDYAALPHRKGLPPGHAEVRRELVVPTIRDGRIVSILGVGNKPTDYDDQDVELVDFVADVIWGIVERKQAEEQLHAYRLQLESQNLELDAFAHTVAHDLKNPVAGIISFAEVWLDDYETMSAQDVVKMLDYVLRAGYRLDKIIEALMLLSGIRRLEIVPEPLDTIGIVQQAIANVQTLIQDQQAQISWIDQPAWPVVLGYAPWVEEVWVNYISNAIKYGGRPPRIEIGASPPVNQSSERPAQVRFWVRDNGSGLTPEEQSKLFTPFTRLGQVHVEGHGLGLSIVQRIIEKLGGEVGVESSGIPGDGSTFSFSLPQAPPAGS